DYYCFSTTGSGNHDVF
nr:immunoglobulin light chain junction region [Macaca mulatta]MOX79121.1 immunoglobulin light chain junction region [Macaca mulatta]MOX79716.1 immunoglobulin light chain junction region [Macaca mulatta]MOX81990.1 immunoglobulin light chain junction region [Macaca mulatta]